MNEKVSFVINGLMINGLVPIYEKIATPNTSEVLSTRRFLVTGGKKSQLLDLGFPPNFFRVSFGFYFKKDKFFKTCFFRII